MSMSTPSYSLRVEAVTGVCPAGEAWAKENIENGRIPVFSCDGPCIRGEIARLAANMVADEVPTFARACQEVWCVPHSGMARWAREADKAIVIDGCFLKCHGRILKNLLGEEKMVQIDAFPLHKRYKNVFRMDDVPEAERKEVARMVADKILSMVKNGEKKLSAEAW